jgi:tetratricopeptide (TPR) repeat protein
LEASKFLIVICSTHAARSKYLNENIRNFKLARGPDHIIPVVIDGQPHNLERECFPPALRHKLGPDGTLTWEQEKLIEVDARPTGKGAKAVARNVAARLLEIDPDEFARRCRERQMRRIRPIAYAAIGLVLLAFMPTNSSTRAWQLLARNEAVIDAALAVSVPIIGGSAAQADKLNIPREVTLKYLNKAERVLDDLVPADCQTKELKFRKGWALVEFARAYDMLGHTEGQKDRIERARSFVRDSFELSQGDLGKLNSISTVYSGIGQVLAGQGALNEAIESYRDGLFVMEHVAALAPTSLLQQRSLSLLYFTLGDLLFEKRKLNEALDSYRRSLLLSGRIVSMDGAQPGWRRDLADVHIAIGDVLSALEEFPDALDHYWKSELVLETLESAEDRRAYAYQLDYTRTRIANILRHEEIPEEHLALWHYDARQGFRAIVPSLRETPIGFSGRWTYPAAHRPSLSSGSLDREPAWQKKTSAGGRW